MAAFSSVLFCLCPFSSFAFDSGTFWRLFFVFRLQSEFRVLKQSFQPATPSSVAVFKQTSDPVFLPQVQNGSGLPEVFKDHHVCCQLPLLRMYIFQKSHNYGTTYYYLPYYPNITNIPVQMWVNKVKFESFETLKVWCWWFSPVSWSVVSQQWSAVA